jgi:hypothetical protein
LNTWLLVAATLAAAAALDFLVAVQVVVTEPMLLVQQMVTVPLLNLY